MKPEFKSADTYLLQTGLKHLGFDPGPLDGDEGPLTRGAKQKWLFTIASDVTNIGGRIVEVAKSQLGIFETSTNRGKGIEKFWTATTYKSGYANREPYCAAFVCWVIREAIGEKDRDWSLPTSPVAHDAMKWAKANRGKGIVTVKNDHAMPGDIMVFDIRHIGIIEKIVDGTFHTIEGNTDGKGSREGDGIYRRIRSASQVQQLIRVS